MTAPVSARRRRAEVGMRVKLEVVLYRVDEPGAVGHRELWAYRVTDEHQRPLVISAVHRDRRSERVGAELHAVSADLLLLLGVHVIRQGSRLLRDDQRWDVAVRSLSESDEIAYRE